MPKTNIVFANRIADATQAVFGDSPISQAVAQRCTAFEQEVANIESARGIATLLIAIVGAKGQGKTWAARQFIQNEQLKSQLRSGDLRDDATTRLVWIGPVPPERLDAASEIYHPSQSNEMAHVGLPYVLLDTPGVTDANQRAAQLAQEALSLAPIKLLLIARDQIRAATNLSIAEQINGSYCIPIISSVEPDEIRGAESASLQEDLRTMREQLLLMAPDVRLSKEVLVPDFEITGDEQQSSQNFLAGVLDRFNEIGLTELELGSSRERRLHSASKRLKADISGLVDEELPQLSEAVEQLNRETEQVPQRVLDALLGSESVLETGIRVRLRARLVTDTSLLWFPYRTVMSTLNLTQGAWDRVMLAMAGSVPSLFGALASFARNVRQNREFTSEIHDGIRKRTQEQVEERLQPLCNQFHRTVMKLRPRSERSREENATSGMHLSGIEELQTRSQRIFDSAIDRNATSYWLIQLFALIGVVLFWLLMSGPVVVIYREYFSATVSVFTGQEVKLEDFPHPTSGGMLTSLFLSVLPLAIYCMVILTWSLSRRRVRNVAREIASEHEDTIRELQEQNVIRLDFEDQLLAQAEYLLTLREA